jgi:hypothetical protein
VSIIWFLAFESGNVFWYENPAADEVKALASELQNKLKVRVVRPAPKASRS